MKTLKELVFSQHFTNKSDAEIIAEWYVENDLALAGIEIISQIAKGKVKSVEDTMAWLTGDLIMYDGCEHLIKTFGLENGVKLDKTIRLWIIEQRCGRDFEESFPERVEWLKSFIPTKKQPLVFWRNFLDWLNEKGIYFKDQKKGDAK